MKALLIQTKEEFKKIIDLRKSILHPDGPLERVLYSADAESSSIHMAVFDEGQNVIACGTMLMEDETEKISSHTGRIRGMAVSESSQGLGLGGAILDALIEEARVRKVTKIWCNARTKILNFYLKRGFVSEGEEFVTAGGVPHFKLVKTITYAD